MHLCEDYVLRTVGDQDILVPLGAKVSEGSALVVLNPTARLMWEEFARGRSPDDVASRVADHFDVDFARARADVQAFLDDVGGSPESGAPGRPAPESEYLDLMRAMLGQAAAQRQPVHGSFELTYRCNLRCRMCYARQAVGDRDQAARELTASAWLDLARQGVDAGMVFLLLTGGEVFARRDFFEIYEPLTRMGLVLALFTNATQITRDRAARLAQAPPSRVEITLYGATAETYREVTGVPGGFAACCNGIEALLAEGIPLGLKTTLTQQNVDELDAMQRLADGWGVPLAATYLLSGRPDGAPSEVEACRLAPQRCVELEAADRAAAHEETEGVLREWGAFHPGVFYCHAGKSSFVVNPRGELGVCQLLPQPAAQTQETGFARAWADAQRYVDSAPETDSECSRCDAVNYCPRCPAWSVMETGALHEPVPYLCEIAKARRAHYYARA